MKNLQNYAALIVMGAVWGAVFPITKIAVSTGYKPFGIMVWQTVIGIGIATLMLLVQGQRPHFRRKDLPVYAGVALLGGVLPNWFSYTASAELPAGIISIIIALVPLFSLPVALFMGFERLSVQRIFGALCGAAAIALLIAPEASLPDPSKYIYVLVMMVAPLLYGMEGNFLTYMGERGLGAVQVLFGSTVVGLVLSVPLSLASRQGISPFQTWSAPIWAIIIAAVINAMAYAGYIWLIRRTGPVFSSQVAYLVTGWGVLISMLILGERYSVWVWGAMGFMLLGIALVRPRKADDI